MKTFKQLINSLAEEKDVIRGAEREAKKIEKRRNKRKEIIADIKQKLNNAIEAGNHAEASKHRESLKNAKQGFKKIS